MCVCVDATYIFDLGFTHLTLFEIQINTFTDSLCSARFHLFFSLKGEKGKTDRYLGLL